MMGKVRKAAGEKTTYQVHRLRSNVAKTTLQSVGRKGGSENVTKRDVKRDKYMSLVQTRKSKLKKRRAVQRQETTGVAAKKMTTLSDAVAKRKSKRKYVTVNDELLPNKSKAILDSVPSRKSARFAMKGEFSEDSREKNVETFVNSGMTLPLTTVASVNESSAVTIIDICAGSKLTDWKNIKLSSCKAETSTARRKHTRLGLKLQDASMTKLFLPPQMRLLKTASAFDVLTRQGKQTSCGENVTSESVHIIDLGGKTIELNSPVNSKSSSEGKSESCKKRKSSGTKSLQKTDRGEGTSNGDVTGMARSRKKMAKCNKMGNVSRYLESSVRRRRSGDGVSLTEDAVIPSSGKNLASDNMEKITGDEETKFTGRNGASSAKTRGAVEEEAVAMEVSTSGELQNGCPVNTETTADAVKPSTRIFKLEHSQQCVVLLPHPSNFSFHGRVLLRCLHGSIEVTGLSVSPSQDGRFYPLFSPASTSALTVETTGPAVTSPPPGGRTLMEDLGAFLEAEQEAGITEAVRCEEEGRSYDVALIFREMSPDSVAEYVESLPRFSELFRPLMGKTEHKIAEYTKQQTANFRSAAQIGLYPTAPNLPGSVYTALPDYLAISQAVNRFMGSSGEGTPIVLVCGWKNVGKSTLCRYLCNSILSHGDSSCYLECDMAQTEFTPPGMLALNHVTQPLLGPPFMHLRKPEKMCFYGDMNVRGDPDSYLKMIVYLVEHYRTNLCHKPLIVNTMGWIQGLGLKLLVDIIHITRPTHIVQIWSASQPRVVRRITPEFLQQSTGWWHQPEAMSDEAYTGEAGGLHSQIINMDSGCDGQLEGSRFKATDCRTMALLADLATLQPQSRAPGCLSALTPLVLPWRRVAVHVTNGHVPFRQIMYALNGSIVGLCQAKEEEMVFVHDDLPRRFYSTPVSQCFGLGIIRGIDPVHKVFYILTAVPRSVLLEVNTLLKGSLTLPEELLTEGFDKEEIPYVTRDYSSVVIGSAAIKVRRNIKQRGR